MRLTPVLAAAGLAVLTAGPAVADPATFNLDTSHTHILFKVNHLGLSNTYGQFDDFSGQVMLDQDNPENSRVTVTIQSASIDTNHGERDTHLRSADFFNAEEYPEITFESTKVETTGDKSAKIYGELTMLGETRDVVLDADLNFLGQHPLPQVDATVAGFTASTTINRTDFGMDAYAPAVSDAVEITINSEALKQ